jgi:hypothetical protein
VLPEKLVRNKHTTRSAIKKGEMPNSRALQVSTAPFLHFFVMLQVAIWLTHKRIDELSKRMSDLTYISKAD